MTIVPAAQPVPSEPPPLPGSPPPGYNGRNQFGVWLIPGLAGQSLVLAGERFTGGIHGSIDGQMVLTCPWPIDERGSTVSPPCEAGGHQIVVYAESWDLGQTVRCDVFVDGRSLSTGEQVSVISERKAAVRRYRSRVANWWRKVSRKPTPVDSVTALAAAAGGSLFRAPLAIAVPAMAFAIVCGWVVYRAGKYVESRALDRDWSSPRVRAAESLIVAACSVAYVAVFVLALRFEYGR